MLKHYIFLVIADQGEVFQGEGFHLKVRTFFSPKSALVTHKTYFIQQVLFQGILGHKSYNLLHKAMHLALLKSVQVIRFSWIP